ncbi:MAG TPA: choice-of-anchor tandem repeat GloVer-containing protein, partial [Bacteroidia bacterium]|nr:choice-of-anchor tandem repeat GloVer-containing protein [Bacteroidia bacterium]
MKNNYLVVITVLSIFISATAANAQLGQLWGVTSAGGANNGGVLYFFDPGSGKDSIVYNFPSNSDPEGTPMQAKDGNIYGTSRVGGSGGYGYIYQYNPVTATFTIKASFAGGASGSNPYCTLIQSAFDGNLYGTTESGGAGNYGTIFQYNISTNTLAIIYAFNGGTLGNTPYSGVVEGTSGTLYGTTYGGGANSKGTLYKYALSPGTYTNLYSFAAASGSLPYGTPYFASDGNLYGMTSSGGAPNAGVMYKYTIAGSTYADLASFPTSSDPEGCFIGAGSTLYGLVGGGGSTGNGTIISCTFGGTVTTLYNFGAPPDGGIPRGNPCLASDGNLYGVTSLGGSSNVGIMFKIPASGGTYTDLFSFTGPNGKQPNYNSSVMELMSVGIKESEPGCSTQVLTAMPRGYAGTLTYSWSTGATTSSITATSSGTYTVTATDGRGITVSNTFTLGVNYSALSATISYGNVSCNGGNNGFANAYVSGGFPPFSYAWTNGATTTSISALTANNYTCTVTDVNGCISSPTVTIDQPSALSLSTSGNTAICNGGSTSLSVTPSGGTASYTYNWEPSTGLSATTGSTVTAFPTTSGFYTIQVIDANNCVASNSIDVTVNPTPTVNASASPTSICAGNSTPITSTVTGGTAPFTYNWGPSSSLSSSSTQNVTATPGSSTTYTLYATDANNCTSIVDVPVTVNSLPTVTANASPSTMCQGSSSVLTASGATSYTWAPGATLNVTTGTNVNATPTISTTYTVTGTNGNGCVNTTTVAVTVNAIPASPTAGSNSPICAGSTLNLTATTVAGATYAWTGPNTYSATTQNPSLANATIAAAGTYSVTATKSGCTSTAGTVAVTVNAIPASPTAGSNSPICAGSTLNLTATTVAGATYAWTGPNTYSATTQNPSLANATIVAAGTYSVTATKSGCTSAAGTVAVTVNAIPSTPTAGSNTPICSGTALNLTASTVAGATYAWTGPNAFTSTSQNPSVTNATTAATGTYSVTAKKSGCTSPAGTTVVVVNPQPTVTVNESPTAICLGNSSTLTATGSGGATPYTYSWAPATDLSVTTGNIVSASPGTTYTYTVTIMDANGCSNTGGAPITVNYAPGLSFTPTSATICSGGNTGITVSGASTYVWSPGSSLNCSNCATVTASPTVNTVYTVTGISAAGCTNTDTVSVFINSLPTITASASSPTICIGSNSTLTASGGSSYTWSPSTG